MKTESTTTYKNDFVTSEVLDHEYNWLKHFGETVQIKPKNTVDYTVDTQNLSQIYSIIPILYENRNHCTLPL